MIREKFSASGLGYLKSTLKNSKLLPVKHKETRYWNIFETTRIIIF